MLKEMAASRWDAFASGDFRTAYYFTGAFCVADTAVRFVLWHDGRSALCSTAKTAHCCDEVVEVETYSIQRCITQPFHDASVQVRALCSRPTTAKTLALEGGSIAAVIASTLEESCPQA